MLPGGFLHSMGAFLFTMPLFTFIYIRDITLKILDSMEHAFVQKSLHFAFVSEQETVWFL